MAPTDLLIACQLTDPDFQRRRSELLDIFKSALLETKELDAGYAYRFPSAGTWIAELAQLITFERACCPFLRFNMRLEPANGPLWLELTGPEGTKDFLRSLFAA
ncbi:MAG: hypothetical protein ABJC10_10980 [Acidobacteriota bacterium]